MKDLTKGTPLQLILTFAVPIFIGSIFQLLYSLIDTRIVGEILGEQSLAAVGATNSVNTLVVGFLIGLTNGFAILVARSYGANDQQELRKTVATTIILGVGTSLVLTIVSVSCLMPLLKVLNTPEEVIEQSYRYIKIIFTGMTIGVVYNICASTLRAIGDTLTPLLFLVLAVICNVALDYTFILKCSMGVEGAAYATVLSQLLSALLCVLYIQRKYPMLHLKKGDFKLEKVRIRKMYSSGLSMGFMMSFVSLGTVALQSSINSFGTETIVAHTAARKITELYMLSFGTLGTTIATYSSQNLGAGYIDRIKEGIRKTIQITWIWSIGVMIMTYTIAPRLIEMVTGTTNSYIIETAVLYLKINTVFYFVPSIICVLRNAMQGIGETKIPIISSMIELVGKVVIVLLLTPRLHYMGIIIAEPIVWILMVIPLLIRINNTPILKRPNSL